jgi:DNA-binding response OmpR family regulator
MMHPCRNKVLVVDDDSLTLKTLGVALESRGYAVILRNSAIGTNATILSERPEVAILDVQMPGLRGDKMVEHLNKNTIGPIPWVIFHSSLPQKQLDLMARTWNAAGAIHKTDLQSFLACFETLLARLRATGTRNEKMR